MKIALGYDSRVGKDTFADEFMKLYPDSLRVSFAEHVYDAMWSVQDTLGLPREKRRRLLVSIAETIKLEYGTDFWVQTQMPKIREAIAAGRHVIVTDLRFEVEMNALDEHGFVFVAIERDIENRASAVYEKTSAFVDKFHVYVNNSGNLDKYIRNVRAVIDNIAGLQLHSEN